MAAVVSATSSWRPVSRWPALRAARVEPGDRVAYLMPNLSEMLIAHFAVPLAGGVLVAMNTRLVAEEMSYILRHSGAKLLVTDAAMLPTAVAAAKDLDTLLRLVVAEDAEIENEGVGADLGADPRLVSYPDFVAQASGDPLPWAVADELTPIAIDYTSGTTGQPKGVVYTHRGAYLNASLSFTPARPIASTVDLPMFHCNGWCYTWGVTATAPRTFPCAGRRPASGT